MTEPIFWLALSILLVSACLAVAIVIAIPALLELARAARSVDKLADTLRRELPPTLEAIRLTGLEIIDLTDDISEGVQNAGNVARQVDQSLGSARNQVREARATTRSIFAGVKAAWRTWNRSPQPQEHRRDRNRGARSPLPPTERPRIELKNEFKDNEFKDTESHNPNAAATHPEREAEHLNERGAQNPEAGKEAARQSPARHAPD